MVLERFYQYLKGVQGVGVLSFALKIFANILIKNDGLSLVFSSVSLFIFQENTFVI